MVENGPIFWHSGWIVSDKVEKIEHQEAGDNDELPPIP